MNQQLSLKKIFRQLITNLLLISIGVGTLSAQTSRKTATTAGKKIVSTSTKAGWSGIIIYRKTREYNFSSDEKLPGTLEKNNERIKHIIKEDYSYEGKLVVSDFAGTGRPTTSGKVEVNDLVSHKTSQTELTRCHSHEPDRMVKADSRDVSVRNGSGEGEGKNFNLSVYGDSYRLSFTLPDAKGTYSNEEGTTYSNLCVPKEPFIHNKNGVYTIPGNGTSVDGQIDPKNPDIIEGSKTWTDGSGNIKGFTYTVTWKLRRKPQPLMITGLKFYHLKYPSPNNWVEINADKNGYTIDGNDVKIVATIANLSSERKSATVNFKELTDNANFYKGNVAADFAPHEEKQVEYVWDTSGYAWKESSPYNYAVNSRDIEVSIPDDRMSNQIAIYPKPVVIIPGMWSKSEKVRNLSGYFKDQNVPWAIVVPPVSVEKTAAMNAPIIDKAVRALQEKENAWHVDLVAHSTGGLMGRAYVHEFMPTQYDNRPTASHLIMLGTPNMGTPCASGLDNIITRFFNRNPQAFTEISHKNMAVFNQTVTHRRGTKFLAFVTNTISPTCQLDEVGDGIVPFISAVHASKTYIRSNVPHEDLAGDRTVFSQIRKWLAVPPAGDHAPDNTSASNINPANENYADFLAENFGKFRNYGARFRPASYNQTAFTENAIIDDEEPEPNFATGIKLAANQSTEVEIPVTAGSRFSLILYASPNVSATLVDDKNEIVGKNLSGTPEASGTFRVITVKKPFQNGKWKLRLENRQPSEAEIAITAFIDYNSLAFSAK